MVTEEDKPSLSDVIYTVVFLINVFVFVYAAYYLFNDYSEVRFMYLTFSILFFMVAVLYYDVGQKLSGAAIHVFSVLYALKIVF
jgi:hypothetical protein